jgi:exonuclease III
MGDMMWWKLCKTVFPFKKDVYLCFIYIPPSNSTYTIRTGCDKQLFEKLEQDIEKLSAIGDVLLMGDFNAHINKYDLDFISNELNDNLDDFVPPNCTADAIHKHRNTAIPQTTNSYGKSVIELCIAAQLRILNGRTLGDSKGQLTFFNYNGSSVVDYCICSSDMLPSVVNFTVGDF